MITCIYFLFLSAALFFIICCNYYFFLFATSRYFSAVHQPPLCLAYYQFSILAINEQR